MPNPLTQPLEALVALANENGTVPYKFALAVSETLFVEDKFEETYGEESQGWEGGVDVGEYISWVTPLI